MEEMTWEIFINLCANEEISPGYAWAIVQDQIAQTKQTEEKMKECLYKEIDDAECLPKNEANKLLEKELRKFVDDEGYLKK